MIPHSKSEFSREVIQVIHELLGGTDLLVASLISACCFNNIWQTCRQAYLLRDTGRQIIYSHTVLADFHPSMFLFQDCMLSWLTRHISVNTARNVLSI